MSIGLNNLSNIILATSFFSGSDEDVETINNMWQHSITTNKLTLEIYDKLLNKKMPALYSSAGLLHDIGKVILHIYYKDEYKKILKEFNDENTLVSLEKEYCNVTHQDIGAYLLNWWELPYSYVEAAMFHHRPFDERVVNKELVSVIHIANHYSLKHMLGDGIHGHLDPRVWSILDLTHEQVMKLIEDIQQE